MADPIQIAAAVLVLWAPGLAIVWALTDGLDWAKFIAASVIASLTVPFAVLYALNLLVGLPIRPLTTSLIALAVAAAAATVRVHRRLEETWDRPTPPPDDPPQA